MKKSHFILPAVLALGAGGFFADRAIERRVPEQDKNRIAADFKGAAESNRLRDRTGAGGYFLGVGNTKTKAYENLMTAEAQKNGYRLCRVDKWGEDYPGFNDYVTLFASFSTIRYGDVQYVLVADKDEGSQTW